MTDRVKGFTVTLSEDIRIDECEQIIQAIKMIKGVTEVEPAIITAADTIVRTRVKYEILGRLQDFIQENYK